MWSQRMSYRTPLARHLSENVALKISIGGLAQIASTRTFLGPRRVIPAGRLRELPVECRIGDQSDTVIYLMDGGRFAIFSAHRRRLPNTSTGSTSMAMHFTLNISPERETDWTYHELRSHDAGSNGNNQHGSLSLRW